MVSIKYGCELYTDMEIFMLLLLLYRSLTSAKLRICGVEVKKRPKLPELPEMCTKAIHVLSFEIHVSTALILITEARFGQ